MTDLSRNVGLGMALAAFNRPSNDRGRSFGLYLLEFLATLVNPMLLLGVTGYALVGAIGRFGDPPDVAAGPVLAVANAGLAANLAALRLRLATAAEGSCG